MRVIFLTLLLAPVAFADSPVKVQTIQVYPDGRRVLIEDTTTPSRVVQTTVDTVIPGRTTRTVTELPAIRQAVVVEEVVPLVVPVRTYAVPVVAAVPAFPVYLAVPAAPIVVVDRPYGLFGLSREISVNGVPVERRGPLGFRRY